ncbi:STAS domain-containing protein [Planosporangium thailandense]|uniref:Anti-sigma factor antagonist n=1 Tax=Planosporangium thailandense TaxID=765197 RepID=A0ABX0Y4B8_9ACTN|nr:STAS domain-containing protein [Planosporangium thailandense]NJC73232.1 STAS domain-containing protein [Planosporangium thailandense]
MIPDHFFVPEPLRITSATTSDGMVRVRVGGEIDMATIAPLSEVLTVLIATRPRAIEVDLADVRFMDSSGVKALVRAHRSASAGGCRVRVTRPQSTVDRVLRICGLAETLGL